MPTNLLPIEAAPLGAAGVGQTALLIAAWRAMEAEQIDPLVIDPIANIFVGPEMAAWVDRVTQSSVSTRHLINYRTRYFDDYLAGEMERGVTQVVLLGAGLDTRSLRLGRPGVTFFEIDRREVIDYKRQRLERFGYFTPSVFVEADYIREDWLAALEARGFKPGEETYFIWEGNTMYIPAEAISSFLIRLRARVARFRISFDYVADGMIEGNAATQLVRQFETMGAKWVTGFADIQPLAAQAGLTLLENRRVSEVVESSPFRVALGDLFADYSICTMSHER